MTQRDKSETAKDAGTPEQSALLPPGPAWRAAEAAGFDMSLLEENLRMTPRARAEQHQRIVNLALQLRQAVKAQHGI